MKKKSRSVLKRKGRLCETKKTKNKQKVEEKGLPGKSNDRVKGSKKKNYDRPTRARQKATCNAQKEEKKGPRMSFIDKLALLFLYFFVP